MKLIDLPELSYSLGVIKYYAQATKDEHERKSLNEVATILNKYIKQEIRKINPV